VNPKIVFAGKKCSIDSGNIASLIFYKRASKKSQKQFKVVTAVGNETHVKIEGNNSTIFILCC
jgi:hypothetical protein